MTSKSKYSSHPILFMTICTLTSAIILAGHVWFGKWPTPLTEDSYTYLGWHPTRSPGYPLLLEIVYGRSQRLVLLWSVQLASLAGALGFAAFAMCQIGTGRLGAFAWVCLTSAIPAMGKWTAQLRPEIPFLACVIFGLAALAMLLARRSTAWGVAAGLATALAILFRPVGYAMLPGCALLLLKVPRHRRFRGALAFALPLCLALSLVVVANGLVRGYFSLQSLGGILLLTKVAPILDPATSSSDPRIERLISSAQPLHEAHDRASGDVAYWLERQGFQAIWRYFGWPAAATGDAEWDAMARGAARDAIQQAPLDYASLVVRQYLSVWMWPWFSTPAIARESLEFLSQPDLAPLLGQFMKLSDLELIPGWLYTLKLFVGGAICIFTLVLPIRVLLARAPSEASVLAGAAAFTTQAYAWLLAVIHTAENRYVEVFLPVLLLTLLPFAKLGSRAEKCSRQGDRFGSLW